MMEGDQKQIDITWKDEKFVLVSLLPTTTMVDQVKHFRVTYNDIHNLIRKATPSLAADFNPDLLVAIGM